MYGWIWRKLPGGWALKTLEAVVLVTVISVTLVVVVFPWIEPKLPFSGNTVANDTGGPTPTPSAVSTGTQPTSTSVPTPASTSTSNVLPGD